MIRTLSMAAIAAAFAAGPAGAAETIVIKTAGKSPDQLGSEIHAAASTVCRTATADATMRLMAYTNCMKKVVARSNAQLAGATPANQTATAN